ncbi:Glycoside hydrolase family 3 [Penicillium canescens]|nr:Glycoside hydrolase family 3 [Penicillium canescens]
MNQPPGTDKLMSAVVAANPNTAVIIQSGTPVIMPWLDEVPALFMPGMVAMKPEVLSRMLSTVPQTLAASYRSASLIATKTILHFLISAREVEFPFGHGLSYTTFTLTSLYLETTDEDLVVSVDVQNTGKVDGAEVVRIYIPQQAPSINRPIKELKGFDKGFVEAGQMKKAAISIPKKYATSFWDEHRNAWVQEMGRYTVLVGVSSDDTPLPAGFDVAQTVWWKGL